MASIGVKKNKDGKVISYVIRVYNGYNKDGKRTKPYTLTWKPRPGMTEKQIEKELNRQVLEFEEQCRSGLASANPKLTLDGFIPQYFEIMKERLSPTTFQLYQDIVKQHISPLLGHLKLKDIKPIHVQEFIQQMPTHDLKGGRKKRTPSTVKRFLTALQSIFNQAVKLELIPANPADAEKLTIPKALTPKIEIFMKQEAAEMLSCLEQEELQFQVLIQLAIMSGARRGELTSLRFTDFDFNTNKMTIERAAVKIPGEDTRIKPPKDYEVRTIAVSPYCMELVKMLKAEKVREAERLGDKWHEGGWLFTQWNGEIMNPQTPTKKFAMFLEKNGLKHRKFHALRHTSATLLLYGGVNIKQVQERLGHGKIETTDKYLHCLAEADEAAVNVLGEMLMGKK